MLARNLTMSIVTSSEMGIMFPMRMQYVPSLAKNVSPGSIVLPPQRYVEDLSCSIDPIATRAAVTLTAKKRSAMYTVCLLTILVKELILTGEPSTFF